VLTPIDGAARSYAGAYDTKKAPKNV